MSDRQAARAALLIQVAGFLSAFGWRTLRHWRRTGDTGLRLSRQSPTTDRVASLLMFGGGFASFVATARAARRSRRAGTPGLGLALMVAGVTSTLRAQVQMGRSWRVGVDASETTELVTERTFTRSRNPIFASMVAVAGGNALAVPTPGTLLGTALLLAGVEVQVRLVEEPYLLRVHGERYRRYAQRTGRFVPNFGRL